ncbi:MAG: hypothetical protein Q4G03_03440 [Planctomycetia bacterium]|nr:hypothetical protein [Planctomycetia bacterium]
MTTRLESHKSLRGCSILATRLILLVLLQLVVCDCYAKTNASGFEPREYETVDVNDSEHGQLRLLQKSQALHDALGVSYQLEIVLETPRVFRLLPDELTGSYGDYDLRLQNSDVEDIDETNERTVLSFLLVPTVALAPSDDIHKTVILPALSFGFKLKPDVTDSDADAPIVLKSKPLLGDYNVVDLDPRDIAEVKPNVSTIRTLHALPWVIVAILLALFALAMRLRRNKNVTEQSQVQPPQQQEPPYNKALRRLKELESSACYQQNQREFYIELDQIVRCYFAEQGQFNAEELTTQEIMRLVDAQPLSLLESICHEHNARLLENRSQDSTSQEFQRPPLDLSSQEHTCVFLMTLQQEQLRREIYATLQTLDLVKFARRHASHEDAQRLLASTRQSINLVDTYFHANLDSLEQRWKTRPLPSTVAVSPTN